MNQPNLRPRAVLSPRQLDPRRNSLNLFRLVLALSVLLAHAFTLAGREEPIWQGESIGGWAVAGFFILSGYLITASRMRTHLAEYLVHRIARIFPAFLMSLVVVVVLFAPLGYHHANGTLSGYLTTANTPLNHVYTSMFLQMGDYSVAGTPTGVPYPGAWNGSLWSLYYEFLCYLAIGFLALIPVVKRSPWPLAAVFLLSVLAQAKIGAVVRLFGGNGDAVLMAKLLPYFLGGSLVYMLRDRIPLRAVVGVPAGLVAFGLISLWPAWGGQAAAPFLAVLLLWLSMVVPSPKVLRDHDISYGVYIYTFPIQQLLAVYGVYENFLVYLVATAAVVVVPATASWLLLERRVMKHVRTYDHRRVSALAKEEPAI
ncbi:acyltransferase family protein [Sanguibacter inulinus]|uniref:Acyltransferase n=1 Tax=Sanguibacter inulinus TaxID=60922 RepID=A0A853EYT1_9MICO|nr:acyltransferase [Sanguibacter inulinus]MBF0723298.1 acyltransferase [Sanguibacter inulinus]NYS94443.1 acyltransferase [Sanguibacter inulinus]